MIDADALAGPCPTVLADAAPVVECASCGEQLAACPLLAAARAAAASRRAHVVTVPAGWVEAR